MGSSSRLRRERAAKRAKESGSGTSPRPAREHQRVTLWDRARYAFDNSMSRGPSVLGWYLGAAVALIIAIFTLLLLLFGAGPSQNPVTAGYQVLLHAIDTGTIAGDSGNSYIVLQLLVTVLGIFIFSAFIGVIANAIDSRLTELRKGRSLVLEKDHTLILGWRESIFTVISELAIANESRTRGACVVVLADEDKAMMDDSIRVRLPDLHGTRVVCRTGSPTVSADLDLVAHRAARSVIILRPDADDPDIQVIKTLLALTREPVAGRHIVAEIIQPHNLVAAQEAGKGAAEILGRDSIASRLIVQTSRQSGAARIYEELFDFCGLEIYQHRNPDLSGMTYGQVLLALEDCVVIGLVLAGSTILNPSAATVLTADDEVIAIAEDDAVLELGRRTSAAVDEAAFAAPQPRPDPPETTLILGWSAKSPAVLRSLDDFAAIGSSAEIVAPEPPREDQLKRLTSSLTNLRVSARHGDTTDPRLLDSLDLARFDRVVLICEGEDDWDLADGRVLLTLIHLRAIAERTGANFKIVSELMDEGDRDLAAVARVDDIVISEQVISYLLAQISENRNLAAIFDELLSADGAEIYMRPLADYISRPASFATIIAAGRDRGESVIGIGPAPQAGGAQGAGVRLGPPKSEVLDPADGGSVIVISER